MDHSHYRPAIVSLLFVVVSLFLLTAISSADPDGGANKPPAATRPTATVAINDFNFEPRELTITAGATVTWVNHDDVPHTATGVGDSPAFDSKALDTDDKFSFTFKQPGMYPYYCKVHTHMTGTIIVK
ncbi:MAG TPA: cupredoxin family copper-binding protein [Tepidisphaeraceae bacterium]|jgi:plastocyanin